MDLPIEFKERMKKMLGEEYDEFEKAFSTEDNIFAIRLNNNPPEELLEIVSDLQKVEWCDDGYYITKDIIDGKHPFHIGGCIYFQEPSAMAVVPALEIEPGDFVLDLCAAPGGKATYAGAKLKGEGLLVANEIIPKRCTILSDNIERMGIKNALVTNENPQNLSEKFPEFFIKIIVDAPCSGEGMFRKEPKAIEEWSVEHTKSCSVRQQHIMDSAIKMLAPGGRLVYSTCTFAPCENEGVVDYVLSNYPDMKLIPIDMPYFTDGVGEWAESEFDMSYTKRIFPHKNRGEGHFVALFEKDGVFLKPDLKGKKKEDSDVLLFREFEKKFLNTKLEGEFIKFGENLYLMPGNIDINKLKVERAGLLLGQCKKGRFEPSHALAIALDINDFKNTYETEDIKKYIGGETLQADIQGWCVVTYHGVKMGWTKGSGGILKNHFPKHMRFR